ncbi:hypothetical protein NBG77_11055 [Proteus terrae]|uniref:hypothetical protein n=1 Tax=Proteus terrae TaxID=1574161 RepID=UPI0021BB056A|nr:hypothetical protein [Proteus terrae]MCT8264003.1 hypothetical protein [Proteus terrae]
MWRFLVGLVFIGMCAGVYLWTFYDSKVINIIELYTGMGVIFSSIGAIATVFVFRSTALATQKTKESVEIARETLKQSIENRKIEYFYQQLNYMFEDCTKKYDDVLRAIPDFTKVDLISIQKNAFFNWRNSNDVAVSKIYKYKEILIYIRGVSNFINFIDSSNLSVNEIENKKSFINMIRDKINNDILFIFAVTVYFKENEFNKEIYLFEKYDFFKRLVFSGEGKNLSFHFSDCFGRNLIENMESFIYGIICKDINESLKSNLHITDCDFDFSIFNSFYINLLVKLKNSYLYFLISKIEENINRCDIKSIMMKFEKKHMEDMEYYFYQVIDYCKNLYVDEYYGTCVSKKPLAIYKLKDLIKIIKDNNFSQYEFNESLGIKNCNFMISKKLENESELIINNINLTSLYKISLNAIHNDSFNEIYKNEVNYSSKIKNILVEKINSSDMCQNSGLSFFFDEDEDKIKCSSIPI